MKNLFCLLCLLIADNVYAENCINAQGTILIGRNGTKYCYSRDSMDWWHANQLCTDMGAQLVNTRDECNTGNGQCPNLKDIPSGKYWAYAIPNGSVASYLDLPFGIPSITTRDELRKALCIISSADKTTGKK